MTARNENPCFIGPTKTPTKESQIHQIRCLNDALRKSGCGGRVLITNGIIERGMEFAQAALKSVEDFAAFTDANDPWGEHDFGSLLVMHQRVLWKIDYYDRAGVFHSPDPSSNKVPLRVLTIMLPEEY